MKSIDLSRFSTDFAQILTAENSDNFASTHTCRILNALQKTTFNRIYFHVQSVYISPSLKLKCSRFSVQ